MNTHVDYGACCVTSVLILSPPLTWRESNLCGLILSKSIRLI
jgi:hypothetical protein